MTWMTSECVNVCFVIMSIAAFLFVDLMIRKAKGSDSPNQEHGSFGLYVINVETDLVHGAEPEDLQRVQF